MWANRNRNFIRKEEWLNKLPRYQGGVKNDQGRDFRKQPMQNCLINLKQEHRIAGGIVLGTAVDYMNEEVGFDNIQQEKNC
jgi:cysteine desulfurase/selenocysteine lyase